MEWYYILLILLCALAGLIAMIVLRWVSTFPRTVLSAAAGLWND